jgi:hypothetical protein
VVPHSPAICACDKSDAGELARSELRPYATSAPVARPAASILIKMGVRVDLERKQLHSRLRGPSEYWLASQYPHGIKSFISYNIGHKVTIECSLVRGMLRLQHRLAMPKAGVSVRGTPSN